MDSDNNLRFKSILSEWTDFCRLWDKGGGGGVGGEGLYRKMGEGRAYVLKVREGFTPSFNIALHMWQRGGEAEEKLLETDDRDEKRKPEMGKK